MADMDDVKAALWALKDRVDARDGIPNGMRRVKEVLKRFGVVVAADLYPAQYQAVIGQASLEGSGFTPEQLAREDFGDR